jgi:hypothetical protein
MIRINLLAEALAEEESRRRDPVKRAYVVAGLLLGLTVVWLMYARGRATKAEDLMGDLELKWTKLKPRCAEITNNRVRTREIDRIVLPSLERLSTNRLLWSHTLEALQYCVISNIEVTELHGQHTYSKKGYSVDVLARAISGPPRVTSVTETVTLTLKCNDLAPDALRNHIRFMDNLVTNQYFRERLRKTQPYEPQGIKTPGDPDNLKKKPGIFSFVSYFAPQTRTTCN